MAVVLPLWISPVTSRKGVMYVLDACAIQPWAPRLNGGSIGVDEMRRTHFVITEGMTVLLFGVSRRLVMSGAVATF